MKWVEGIPTIFGKGNWCNRLKRFQNHGGKDSKKALMDKREIHKGFF